MGKKIALFLLLTIIFVAPAMAQQGGGVPVPIEVAEKTSSGLPIPRFVSLSSEKVFVRTGPALRYPIKWVYKKDHLPVEIIQEFDTWRKIRDMEGDDGWVHQSLLSGDRMGIVKGELNQPIRKDAEDQGKIIAYLEPNVIAAIRECRGAWCEVAADGYTGWMPRKFLWGIYDSEDFD